MGASLQMSWLGISGFAPQAVLGQFQQVVEFAESQLCMSSEAMQQHQDLPAEARPVSYLQSYFVPFGSCSYPLNVIKQKQ